MSEKLKQIDPAGLLNEEGSDQEMDTQDQPGAHGELQVQKKKTVHHVSSSGEEEEEGDDATAAADKHPTATAADTADTTPKTAHAATNPGFRIVDIEMPGYSANPDGSDHRRHPHEHEPADWGQHPQPAAPASGSGREQLPPGYGSGTRPNSHRHI
jgi:hypothetical protein